MLVRCVGILVCVKGQAKQGCWVKIDGCGLHRLYTPEAATLTRAPAVYVCAVGVHIGCSEACSLCSALLGSLDGWLWSTAHLLHLFMTQKPLSQIMPLAVISMDMFKICHLIKSLCSPRALSCVVCVYSPVCLCPRYHVCQRVTCILHVYLWVSQLAAGVPALLLTITLPPSSKSPHCLGGQTFELMPCCEVCFEWKYLQNRPPSQKTELNKAFFFLFFFLV